VWPRPPPPFPWGIVLTPGSSPCLPRSTFRPFRPQSPSHLSPEHAFARYFSASGCCVYPPGRPGQVGGIAVAQSGVHHGHAGSPAGLAVSGSSLSFLRTGLSPPVALHPASRRRSYSWLQACNADLAGTFTPLIERLHRRTCRRPARRLLAFTATRRGLATYSPFSTATLGVWAVSRRSCSKERNHPPGRPAAFRAGLTRAL
jgi:hypothetical protein